MEKNVKLKSSFCQLSFLIRRVARGGGKGVVQDLWFEKLSKFLKFHPKMLARGDREIAPLSLGTRLFLIKLVN